MAYITRANYKPEKGQKLDRTKHVEIGSYIPPKKQIESFIQAGIRLNQTRAEQYDFKDEASIDDSYTDPTRRPGFDLADASAILAEKQAKFTKACEEAKTADEASKKEKKPAVKEDPEDPEE